MNNRQTPKRFGLRADLQKQGRALFTGRAKEIETFRETLRIRQNWENAEVEAKRIFNIYAQGGAGKTTLLREFEAICLENDVDYIYIDAKRTAGESILDVIDLMRVIRGRFSQTRFQNLTRSNPFAEFDEMYKRYKGLEEKVKQQTEKEASPQKPSAAGFDLGGGCAYGIR